MSRIAENQRRILGEMIAGLQPQLRPRVDFGERIRAALGHRSFGSRDRRVYRELIFAWLRYREWIEPEMAANPVAGIDAILTLAPAIPELRAMQETLPEPLRSAALETEASSARREALEVRCGRQLAWEALAPEWFREHCPDLFEQHELMTLVRRPPLWLRAQGCDLSTLATELRSAGVNLQASPILAGAFSAPAGTSIESQPAYREGRVEVQDISSQAALAMAAPAEGERWLDACAGAGGKALQLASLLGPSGRVDAFDLRRDALEELRARANRAGCRQIRILAREALEASGSAGYDGVLVDAPCTAAGTWRRRPYLRHQLQPGEPAAMAEVQLETLRRYGRRAKPGGRLVYITCSLSRLENQGVVERFLAASPEFTAEPVPRPFGLPASGLGITVMPSLFDGDGFFVACFRRQA
jgi:16S rRNA (cytosine967-C5)-methyltransferase